MFKVHYTYDSDYLTKYCSTWSIDNEEYTKEEAEKRCKELRKQGVACALCVEVAGNE